MQKSFCDFSPFWPDWASKCGLWHLQTEMHQYGAAFHPGLCVGSFIPASESLSEMGVADGLADTEDQA